MPHLLVPCNGSGCRRRCRSGYAFCGRCWRNVPSALKQDWRWLVKARDWEALAALLITCADFGLPEVEGARLLD